MTVPGRGDGDVRIEVVCDRCGYRTVDRAARRLLRFPRAGEGRGPHQGAAGTAARRCDARAARRQLLPRRARATSVARQLLPRARDRAAQPRRRSTTDPTEARDIRVVDETTGRLASTIAHTCVAPGQPLKSSASSTLAPELAGHRYTLRVDPAEESCSAATPPVRANIQYDLQALDVEGRGGPITVQIPRVRSALVTGLVRAFENPSVFDLDGTIVLRSVRLDETVDTVSGRATSVVTREFRGRAFDAVVLPGTDRADIIPSSEFGRMSNAYAVCVDCSVPSQDPAAKPGTHRRVSHRQQHRAVVRHRQARERASERDRVRRGAVHARNLVGLELVVGVTLTPTQSALLTRAQSGVVGVFSDCDCENATMWNVAGALTPGSTTSSCVHPRNPVIRGLSRRVWTCSRPAGSPSDP